MADILHADIKMMQSQNLDDTDEGGGQMTSNEVVDNSLNNLFADISRLDRTYGRVSLRKAFLSVQTENRATYYGSHMAIMKQADDPLVSVTMFTTEDWFDERADAVDQIERYLAKGTQFLGALYGNHYQGSRFMTIWTSVDTEDPYVGDVIILEASGSDEYVRIVDMSTSETTFVLNSKNYTRKLLEIEISNPLLNDYVGEEITANSTFTTIDTKIYVSVVADASQYYGIMDLAEDITQGDLTFKVSDIQQSIVPSAQSQTALTDFSINSTVPSSMVIDDTTKDFSKTATFTFAQNGTLVIGEPFTPGTLTFGTYYDDGVGHFKDSSDNNIGTINYVVGEITLSSDAPTGGKTNTLAYERAIVQQQLPYSLATDIEVANRGYSYVKYLNPLPSPLSVKVDFLSNGRWYSLTDQGGGLLKGVSDDLGTGTINYDTGSVSVSLGYLPDVGSKLLFFWGTNFRTVDITLGSKDLHVIIDIGDHVSINESVTIEWEQNSTTYNISNDNLDTELFYNSGSVGFIQEDKVIFKPPVTPITSQIYDVSIKTCTLNTYTTSTFPTYNLDNSGNIVPGTVSISGTFEYTIAKDEEKPPPQMLSPNTTIGSETGSDYILNRLLFAYDDGSGKLMATSQFDNSTTLSRNVEVGTVDYTTGAISFSIPDTFKIQYKQGEFGVDDYADIINNFVESEVVFSGGITLSGNTTNKYREVTDPTTVETSTPTATLKYYLQEDTALKIVPNSIKGTLAGVSLRDDGDGNLIELEDHDAIVGTIDYVAKELTLTTLESTYISNTENLAFTLEGGLLGDLDDGNFYSNRFLFRTPSVPVVSGSFTIRGTYGAGYRIGTANLSNEIHFDGGYPYMNSTIDLETGIIDVKFPHKVNSSTVTASCVISSYMPLNADLLGLDPVRLPLDGKVFICREGDVVLIHNTTQYDMPSPLESAQVIDVGMTDLDAVDMYDANGDFVPPLGIYEVSLSLGRITMDASLDLTGYTEPLYAMCRYEDMLLVNDVQVTGDISVTTPISRDYTTANTYVSSVMPIGDLQSRVYNLFTQESWTGEWSNDRIGNGILAQYNDVDHPIEVINKNATQERWAIIFESENTVQIVGEHLGVLATGVSILNDVAYPQDGSPYWTIRKEGWGSGWQIGHVVRFNTNAANYPVYFVRATMQGDATEAQDSYSVALRGDSS